MGGQPSFQPVQTVLDEQATTFPHLPFVLGRRRVCSPGGTIQSSIRQPETLLDQPLLGVGGGHLRDGIHLIQGQVAGGEALPEDGQILEPPGHPDQEARR
jgi:hypothetical protein